MGIRLRAWMASLSLLLIGAVSPPAPMTPVYTGLNGCALLDADGASVPCTTVAMDMNQAEYRNQLELQIELTWGTSTVMYGYCSTTSDGSHWAREQSCASGYTSLCKPHVYEWDAADWPAGTYPSFHVPTGGISSKCQFWSTLGTGTAIVRGTRSSQ